MKVLMGLGNPLAGDDGVGLRVAEGLLGTDWVVIPAGISPENALGLIQKLRPELLVVVDAAEMGLPTGSFRILPLEWVPRFLGSTHGLPLGFLIEIIRGAARRVVLIGVQPGRRSGEGLSPEVERAAEELVGILRRGELESIPGHGDEG